LPDEDEGEGEGGLRVGNAKGIEGSILCVYGVPDGNSEVTGEDIGEHDDDDGVGV
jgi:hypothetical protein